ncbi:hypothetical protein DSCA_33310 [Desulfosarcina alkanivorans]|uniref:histidine kinase n=1 Tax=Desulfosarcina alkanivorans TaxID=571177 RepID=A0A5K7YQZ7_9BACT|nr:response regulator [Desulfosarcina alkanivorans]BBO69401.1 hypothetical protein DSCA_33310 [Desulfosarcina alkanivorans]
MTEPKNNEPQPHVLVVDDDAIMRGVACESLENAGFLVSEAENGLRALEAVERHLPDIILLDVMMPEMDGFDTAIALRHMPCCEGMPILIMTALDDLDSINRAYEVGATDFITKPINWVILVQRIRYMMRAVRMMDAQKRLEEELQQAQKLEVVATLAGGVAHDFNNLLQTIQGASELLRLNLNNGNTDLHGLDQIIETVERGGALTRQLLTYSRKIESEKRPINLNHRVRQVHQLLQRTIPKMVHMDLRLDANLKMVDADPVQMEQVLMNLAINASDAMPDGGSLVIETKSVALPAAGDSPPPASLPQDGVLISVSDTGHGMDRDTVDQIFAPFFTTKAPGKGTGLGLAMVYGIVNNHDGQITCSSSPGRGTCFRIYLPAVESPRERTPTRAKVGCRGGSETILVVDDDEAIRHCSQLLLENAGYRVLTVSAGERALEVVGRSRDPIHIVMLDLIMPGMGGKKCLQALLKSHPGLSVVIISGCTLDERTMQTLESSTSGYLRKPYTREQLLNTIRNVLDAGGPTPLAVPG